MGVMRTRSTARKTFRKHTEALDAAERWAGWTTYPRELTPEAARQAAIAWCIHAGIGGTERRVIASIFQKCATAQIAKFNAGQEVHA